MYAAADDYGTSYYFRGAVNNNRVSFAGFYWRIIRINGDNSIRMIYTGTTAPTESQAVVMTGTGTEINSGSIYSFNTNTSIEYVGYKFEFLNNHGTTNDSNIKIAIDTWYSNNLTGYTTKIADVVYCGDRNSTGNVSTTNFEAYVRIETYKAPILTCSNISDAYTVSDSTHGNASLTYPIALLTADEVAMAGGIPSGNSIFYLFTGNYYWLMSPGNFYKTGNGAVDGPYVYVLDYVGRLLSNRLTEETAFDARPVISLKPTVTATGTGVWNDPYIVQ